MIRTILIFVCCPVLVLAQELIPMATWRSHFNYQESYWIEETESKIFATAKNGLTYYDPSDNSLTKLSKLDGLNDSEISALAYNTNTEILVLGYTSGNIDVISSEGITNYSALIDSDVVDSKSINDISFYNDQINIATVFGLLVLELETGLIRDAYRNLGETGEVIAVKNSAVLDDKIYLATSIGVLMGDLVSGDNLQDFSNWNRFKESTLYNQDILSVEAFNNTIYALSATVLYKLENNGWTEVSELNEGEPEYLRLHSKNARMLIIYTQGIGELLSSGEIVPIDLPGSETPNDALISNNGEIWYTDNNNGLTKYEVNEPVRFVLPGPVTDEVYRLSVQNSVINIYPTLDVNVDETSNGYGFSMFDQGVWDTYSVDELQSLDNISMHHQIDNVEYISSFGKGLLDKTQSLIYDETNSPLTRDNGNILITGLDSDLQNNLWISNLSSLPLIKLSSDKLFSSYNLGLTQTDEPTSIQINNVDQIWMSLGLDDGIGVVAFDIASETSRYISSTNTSLPSNDVNDIAFDKEGAIWFATDLGVAFFASPFGLIESTAIDVILPVIDNNFLFRDEKVNAITIDGGNRKWMATDNGAWLFDEDVNELILSFTTENSPLPSNVVLDIEINGSTGEVFFATDQGIVSYRSDATDVSLKPNTVEIYPNPVTSSFHGTVGFRGLIENANLKITTTSGRLVREIQGAGAAAAWDLNDYSGSRVRTGVYMIFSASADGSETYVGKIAVVN